MKPFAMMAAILLAASAAAETNSSLTSEKDMLFFQDYFEVSLEKQAYPEGYEGWLNYTAHITCKNGTEEGDLLFPYEEVQYVLGMRGPLGLIEKIAETTLIYVPGTCDRTLSGSYFKNSLQQNLTLVHLFKPQHSRVPAKEYEMHNAVQPIRWGLSQRLAALIDQLSGKTLQVALAGLGVAMMLAGIVVYRIFPLKSYWALMIILGLLTTLIGTVWAVT